MTGTLEAPPTVRRVELRPQAGPQETFLSTTADIAIYGGAAGGGKSYALLLDPVRFMNVKKCNCVIFRRNATHVMNEGGLWDASWNIYGEVGAYPQQHKMRWLFNRDRLRVRFAHLEHENDVNNWQGTEITILGFDELTHFTKSQFFYMVSRNRSTCGVRPYIRATTNPDPDSWVADFISWWIDQNETLPSGERNPNWGFPIPERASVIRWFIRMGDDLVWGDSREQLVDKYKCDQIDPKSVTFIPAKVTDNKVLMERDPGYLANLRALTYVDRMRLLEGNWKVRAVAGLMFKRGWFTVTEAGPHIVGRRVRFWDRAATAPSEGGKPDWTVGLRLSRDVQGIWFVEHIERFQATAGEVLKRMKAIASQDGTGCEIGIYQDPGSAGKGEAEFTANELSGYNVHIHQITGDKITLAKPVSSQAEAGNIRIIRGSWMESFLGEIEAFPDGANDDQVDAFSGAFNSLTGVARPGVQLVHSADRTRIPLTRGRRGMGLM